MTTEIPEAFITRYDTVHHPMPRRQSDPKRPIVSRPETAAPKPKGAPAMLTYILIGLAITLTIALIPAGIAVFNLVRGNF